ncbi:hypothetical protein XENOCAPTIV_002395 [Xenoophorus captivus]|uniref:Secreted protein n=1 Tax=Xenoophorus captivus TaxID=1517983 RepID=A0ABV0SCW2_9TELE
MHAMLNNTHSGCNTFTLFCSFPASFFCNFYTSVCCFVINPGKCKESMSSGRGLGSSRTVGGPIYHISALQCSSSREGGSLNCPKPPPVRRLFSFICTRRVARALSRTPLD